MVAERGVCCLNGVQWRARMIAATQSLLSQDETCSTFTLATIP